jgi:hypothetical protein
MNRLRQRAPVDRRKHVCSKMPSNLYKFFRVKILRLMFKPELPAHTLFIV